MGNSVREDEPWPGSCAGCVPGELSLPEKSTNRFFAGGGSNKVRCAFVGGTEKANSE